VTMSLTHGGAVDWSHTSEIATAAKPEAPAADEIGYVTVLSVRFAGEYEEQNRLFGGDAAVMEVELSVPPQWVHFDVKMWGDGSKGQLSN